VKGSISNWAFAVTCYTSRFSTSGFPEMKRIRELIPIKPGEVSITALMFFCHFGVMAFYYILDPLRPALFVTNVGSNQLPYAYILTAIVAGAIATLMFKAGQRWSAISLLTATGLAVIAALFYFSWAMEPGRRDLWYLPWIFYVYMKIVPALTTAQFWILAGYVYDNRQAKRLYRVLILGAGLGALSGSYIPAFLSQFVNTHAMLMICVAIWVVLLGLAQIVWRHRRPGSEAVAAPAKKEEPKEKFSDLWKLVFSSRHLLSLSLLIFLMFIVSNIADWQMNTAAQLHYGSLATKAERSLKIGELFGRISLLANALSLIFQLFITGFVVRRLGILATIIFLPMCLFLSSLGLMMFPTSLIAAALVRISDWSPRYSLDKTGRELLYLPLTPAVRKKLKVFIDVFVDRTGRAAAAPVILACTALGLGLRGTSAVAVVLTLTCAMLCVSLAKTYVNTFREKLKLREVDLGEFENYVTDPSSVQLLVGALASTHERQILYGLQLLQSVRGIDFSKELRPLLSHSAPYIRQEAARTLQALPVDCTADAERLLLDTSDGVRLAAIDYLCSHDAGRSKSQLESLLKHNRVEIRMTAARWAADHAGPNFHPQPELLRELMSDAGPHGAEARAIAAGLTSRLAAPEAVELLQRLIKDDSPEVVSAAARAAGKGSRLELVFPVLELLKSRKFRKPAREALLAYGDRIAGTLGDILSDTKTDIALRREIPWVLSRIPSRWSIERLVDNLGANDISLRLRVVKALNRIHKDHPANAIETATIHARIDAELHAYYEILSMRMAIDTNGSTQERLLSRALRERLDQHLDIIFRLLGLQQSPKEMQSAFAALKGDRPDRRMAAIELLDNVLPQHQKSAILPILESTNRTVVGRAGKFEVKVLHGEDALRLMLSGADSWLRVLTIHEIGSLKIHALVEDCRRFSTDGDPWTREAATWALSRW